MEKITLPQVRDLGQTIGDPFLFVRANFGLLCRAFLFYAVPPLLVAATLSAFSFKSILSNLSVVSPGGQFGSFTGMIVLAYLIFILTSFFQQLYICEFMLLKEHAEDVTNAQVLQKLKSDWKNVLVTSLTIILIGSLTGGVIGLFMASSRFIGSTASGLAIFILYLFIIYSFIPLMSLVYVRLRENLGIFQSLVKCFQITRGNWWRTFVAAFVIFMIFYALMVSAIVPFAFISALGDLHKTYSGTTSASSSGAGNLSTAVIGVAITIGVFAFFFIMNLVNAFAGINYFSLSEKFDSYHLKAEINEIGLRDDRNVHRQEGEY